MNASNIFTAAEIAQANRAGRKVRSLTLPTPRSRASEESRRWQRRRAQLLHTACQHVAELLAGGQRIGRALKCTARKFRSRRLGGGRQLALSEKSMRRHWDVWTGKRGEAAFLSRYVAGRAVDLDPLLLLLIIDSSIRRSKTVSEILVGVNAGNRFGRASLGTIYRALPAESIKKFILAERQLIRARKRAEQKLLTINARLRELRSSAEQKFMSGSANVK